MTNATVNVTVTDANGLSAQMGTIIYVTTSGAPVITSANTASGTDGSAFSYQITATNSPTSYNASNVPAGTSVNTSTGLVSGTLTTVQTITMVVSATNAFGTGNQNVSVNIGSGGVPSLPSGVTAREPDGTRTYFATNSFSVATAWPTSIAWPTGGTFTYASGWDSPNFFPIGGSLSSMNGSTDQNAYLAWGFTTKFYSRSDMSQSDLHAAGLSLIQGEDDMHLFLANNSGSLDQAVIGLAMADESQNTTAWPPPIAGDPTGAASQPVATLNTNSATASGTTLHFANTRTDSGNIWPVAGMTVTGTNIPGSTTISSSTSTTVVISNAVTGGGVASGAQIVFGGVMTHAMQNGRPWGMGVQGFSFLVSQVLGSGVATPFTQTYPDPSSVQRRPHDMFWMDAYCMTTSRRPAITGQKFANMVEGTFSSSTPFTMMEMAKGTNQGLFCDYMRRCVGTDTRPLFPVLELGDGRTNTPYLPSQTEENWQCWAIIIHGARGLFFFDYSDYFSGGGQQARGSLSIPSFNTNQSVSFNGTIGAAGTTLTVSGMTSGSMTDGIFSTPAQLPLQPGMVITSGLGGPPYPVIVAQPTFATEATFTGTMNGQGTYDGSFNTTCTMTVASIAAGSGGSGTIPIPSILDMSGAPNGWDLTTGGAASDICVTNYVSGSGIGSNGTYGVDRIPGRLNLDTAFLTGAVASVYGSTTGTTVGVSLTTSSPVGLIVVCLATAATTGSFNTPTASGLTFVQRGSTVTSAAGALANYVASHTSNFSGTITCTRTNSVAYEVVAFGAQGVFANTASTSFDPNLSTPASNSTGAVTGTTTYASANPATLDSRTLIFTNALGGSTGAGPTGNWQRIANSSAGLNQIFYQVNGAGTYTLTSSVSPTISTMDAIVPSHTIGPDTWGVYCPGMNGTYKVAGYTGAAIGSPTAMVAQQPDNTSTVLGPPPSAPLPTTVPTGSFTGTISALNLRVRDLAPLINSRFAIDYVKTTSTNIRYIFPNAILGGVLSNVPLGSSGDAAATAHAYYAQTGIDCCVHYYEGGSYTSVVSGETIFPGFYIFATTAYPEDATIPISVTFVINDPLATNITVIGEARNISFSSGAGTSSATFTDTFAYAWTVHIYRVNH